MVIIDNTLIEVVKEKARLSSRKRMNHNFHSADNDPIQRLINVLNNDTYIRPHKHEKPDKREVFLILSGSIAVVIFDDNGNITNFTVLNSSKGVYGLEISPRTWHTLVALEDNSVVYEIKDGPYDQKTDKVFASWSPEEDSGNAETFLNNIKKQIFSK